MTEPDMLKKKLKHSDTKNLNREVFHFVQYGS